MKNTAKKLLCIVLCVAMMAGTLCTAAFAKEWSGKTLFDPEFAVKQQDDDFLYVAVGDSASMGYLMDDFNGDFQHVSDVVRGNTASTSSSMSVYSAFSKYLEETAGIKNLVSKDLSMTGMRPLELRSFLDESYYAAHSEEVKTFDDGGTFWGYHVDEYLNSNGRHGYQTYENIHKTYTNFLYNADLITIDLTMNDFGTYLGQRVQSAGAPNFANETLAKVLDEGGSPEVAKAVESLREALDAILAKVELPLPAEDIEGYLDMFLYCFANFAINFSKVMDMIYTNNPDVEVIVIGPFNVMEGVTFKFGDLEINAELVWKALNEAVTAYVCAVDSHRSQYKFADMSGGCETCITAIANGEWDKYDVMTYEYLSYFLGGNLDQLFGFVSTINPQLTENWQRLEYALENRDAICAAVPAFAELFGVIDLVLANLTKIANAPMIPFMEVIGGLADGSMNAMVESALMNFEGASEAEIGAAHTALRLVAVYSLGCHPDANGYDAKAKAVIAAYESLNAADGTYITRAVNGTVNFIGGTFKLLFEKIQAILDSIFAPIFKLFDSLSFC